MRKTSKKVKVTIFLLLVLSITIGYAVLQSTLSINGTSTINNATWNIHWDNLSVTTGSITGTKVITPAYIKPGDTEVSYSIVLSTPGEYYEFTVDAVNEGSIDAMISTFSKGVYAANGTTPKTLPDYLEYTVTYSDGIEIANNQLLESGKTETYKVRVHYKEDITASQLPSTADNYMFKFSVTYAQADDTAQEKPVPDFTTDSWETIINNVRNNPSVYELGNTKIVDMGTFGTHTLRIANTTTPAECSTEGFSQTACGFVLEFEDIVSKYYNNVVGWSTSELRTYVNDDIYNALPEVLRSAIINTMVVSGHGSTAGETNFISTDKLYLLSTHEVWEDVDGDTSSGPDYYDTAYNNTRQLDYYAKLNVTTSSHSGAIKQYNGSNTSWHLRSVRSNTDKLTCVTNNGVGSVTSPYVPLGVSPAFRLG